MARGRGILMFLLAISATAWGQPDKLPAKNIIFEQLPEKLGLSQSSINCILQDHEGYLWVGTWSGLIRYDGYSTTVFHSDNAPGKIKSNKIITIYEDRNGFIWVGTHQGGLFRYDRNNNSFKHYSHQPNDTHSLSNNSVWSIQEDKKGQLWVGTEIGLNVMDQSSGTFKVFYHNDNSYATLSQNFVTDIMLASDGQLWVATEYGLDLLIATRSGDSVIYSFKNHLYEGDTPNAALHHHVYQVCETLSPAGKSVIWFTTMKGIKKLQNGKIENFMAEGKTSGFNLFRSLMLVPGDHPYLIAGSETGLKFFDPVTNKFIRFLGDDPQTNLSHNSVTALCLDRTGVFWVGTKKGLNKADSYSKNFESYQTASFDPTRSIITGLCSSEDGGYWISTIGGGLFKFKDKTFQRYRISTSEDNYFIDFIQTIYKDARGHIWIGTAGAGVYRFNEKTLDNNAHLIAKFDHYTLTSPQPLNDAYIMSFAEDMSGNVWIGTWGGGLNRITPEGKAEQFNDPLLKQVPLVVMHADQAGALWIGTRGNGLYRVKSKTNGVDIKHYFSNEKTEDDLTNNFVNTIYEDHAGGLWIGTEGGLNTFDRRSESFSHNLLEQEPESEVIVSILEDEVGRLWLANWDGLTVVDPMNPKFVKNYDTHDRIQGGFFYSNVCFKDSHGRLLFGGSNGFNIIDPSAMVGNPIKTKVAIIDFQIFNKPVHVGEELEGRIVLDKPLTEMKEVTLKYFENSVSFEFTALNLASPDKIRYAYKLEGFDPDWNYTDASRRYANYTNLNGKYTFLVKATNNDGVWNDEVSSVRLVILPPWWKTTWAILIYIFISIVVLHFFRKLVLMRANLIHDIRLERIQRENMEKLNQAKLQFFTNISHEFRTPLTLILGPVHALLESGEGSSKFMRDKMLLINNNAQRLLRLVTQLLDFRKAESGNMKLEVAEGNLVKFVKEIQLSFASLAEQMNIEFKLYSASNIMMAWFDRDQFEKILFNLLSNAFRHTPENGRISITLTESKDSILIIVEDNGKGIKREHFESIFQTFFSYDEDRYQTGTGIGLALTRSLVDMHHGSIQVESNENEFTRFTIRVLKGSSHFDASELQNEVQDTEKVAHYPVVENNYVSSGEVASVSLSELPKLLIVEDNAEVRGYVKSIFLGEYVILEAEDGKEGLATALEETPDVIISDVMMPLMDGIALCKSLKSNLKTSHIPVILLTARTSLIFKVEGLERGADDYITKPFNPKVLQLKVSNLVRNRELMRKAFRDKEVLTVEPHRITLNSLDEKFIAEALKSVEDHMDDAQYSVDDLIKDVGMSRMQLYRKLKALTGQSANEFIRTIRLKRAAQLLEQNQLTIAEITYEVGFNDLQYFRECFKKAFGVTPSEYAQRESGNRIVGDHA